ncbi:hypothetical protein [Cognaticolwellia mytili]|uniref:hypothetical protein n=1 Tax=Cognaticolwellia mytili TaxID=1888913 RepID=UPI000A174954|nr:hypothetical protein [Cognaticolwellia mytili]
MTIEHGSYSVTLDGKVLSVTLSGMFNEFATTTVCQKIKNQVDSLNKENFGILLNCATYEGSTREAHKISNLFLLWLNKQTCSARAIIYSQKLYFDIVKNEQPALFELLNRKEFYDLTEAKAWLASQL